MNALASPTIFRGQPAVALRAPDGAAATVLLHGAQVVSWIPAGGVEQFYLSPMAFYGPGRSVRGGVPVIFPQFAERGPLPRHGFVRSRAWTLHDTAARATHAQAVLRIGADESTRAAWPHEFEVELTVAVSGRQLDIELAVANTGSSVFEFSAALHNYLSSDDALKLQLEGLQGVSYLDASSGEWQQQWGDVVSVIGAIDRIYRDVPRSLTLREAGRRLSLNSTGFADAVVWNPGPEQCARFDDMPDDDWRRMLCVEAAQVIEPVRLEPGEDWSALQTLVA